MAIRDWMEDGAFPSGNVLVGVGRVDTGVSSEIFRANTGASDEDGNV